MEPINFSEVKYALLTPSKVCSQKMTYCGGVYSNNSLIRDLLRPSILAYKSNNSDFYFCPKSTESHRSAYYGGYWIDHFGHFLLETLPLLGSMAASNTRLPILFHYWNSLPNLDSGYVADCLKALGIDKSRIYFVHENAVIAESLHICIPAIKLIGGVSDHRAIYSFHQIRKHFGVNKGLSRKVYFTRRKTPNTCRKVIGERDIESIFVAKGYEIVAPERLDFKDQVRLVSSCAEIAGVDGSALHLAAFANPLTKMRVLATRDCRLILAVNKTMGLRTSIVEIPLNIDDSVIRAISTRLG